MRIMRSKSGEKLYRNMTVRVIMPGQKDVTWRARAKPGTGYGSEQLDEMLEHAVKRADQMFPSVEFRLVELAPNDFKFIYEGRKGMPEKIANPCGLSAQSAAISEKVCSVSGHTIGVYQDGIQITSQGAIPKAIKFCSKCGFGLSEIRGDMDLVFQDAVRQTAAATLEANKPKNPGDTAQPGVGPIPISNAKDAGDPPPEKANAATAD